MRSLLSRPATLASSATAFALAGSLCVYLGLHPTAIRRASRPTVGPPETEAHLTTVLDRGPKTCPSLNIRVTSCGDTPIAGASIEVVNDLCHFDGLSNDTGSFSLSNAPCGTYRVLVAASCHISSEQVIDVRSAPVEHHVVLVERLAEFVFRNVTDAWADAAVTIRITPPDGPSHLLRVRPGTSALHPVPSGACHIALYDDRTLPLEGPTMHQLVMLTDARVEIVTFDLPPGSRLAGTALHADGQPFTGTLLFRDAWHVADCDQDGAFDAGFLHAGPCAVGAFVPSGSVMVDRLDIRAAGSTRSTVTIRDGATITARLVNGSDKTTELLLRQGLVCFQLVSDDTKEPVAFMAPEDWCLEVPYIRPGSYTLQSRNIAAPIPIVVGPWERVDLGTITIRPRW